MLRIGLRYAIIFLLNFPDLGSIDGNYNQGLIQSINMASRGLMREGRTGISEANGGEKESQNIKNDKFIEESLGLEQGIEEIAKFTVDCIKENLGVFDDPEKLDKNFVYYFFKIADWCTYRSDPKTTMMGETVTNYSLLEKLNFDNQTLFIIQTT